MDQHPLALSIDVLNIVASSQHSFPLFLITIPILFKLATHPNIGLCFRGKDYTFALNC